MRWALVVALLGLLPLLPAAWAHDAAHTVTADLVPVAGPGAAVAPGEVASLRLTVDVRNAGTGLAEPAILVKAAWRELGLPVAPEGARTDAGGRATFTLDAPPHHGRFQLLVWTIVHEGDEPTGGAIQALDVGEGGGEVSLFVEPEIVFHPSLPQVSVRLEETEPTGTVRLLLLRSPPNGSQELASVPVDGRRLVRISPEMPAEGGIYGLVAIHARANGASHASSWTNVTWIGPDELAGGERVVPGPAPPLVLAAAAVALARLRRGRRIESLGKV